MSSAPARSLTALALFVAAWAGAGALAFVPTGESSQPSVRPHVPAAAAPRQAPPDMVPASITVAGPGKERVLWVAGERFTPGERIVVEMNSGERTEATADARGAFSVDVKLKDSTVGSAFIVTATDGTGKYARDILHLFS